MLHRALTLTLLALVLAACGRSSDQSQQGPDAATRLRLQPAAVQTLAPAVSPTPVVLVYTLPPPTVPAALAGRTSAPLPAAVSPAGPTSALAILVATAEARATQTAAFGPGSTGQVAVTTAPTKIVPTTRSASGARSAATTRPTATRHPTYTPRPSSTPRLTTTPRPPTPTRGPTPDTSVLAALRSGGLVIYLRHGRTDWTQDPRELEWKDELLKTGDSSLFDQCDRQRLLSDDGRGDARAVGDAVRRLGIPIGQVLTSPWCRARETSRIAFGVDDVAEDKLWDTGYLVQEPKKRNHYRDALHSLLSDSPGPGSNRVLVGHMPQLADVAGIQLSEGEAAIVRPEGRDFRVLARVPATGWDRLANVH